MLRTLTVASVFSLLAASTFAQNETANSFDVEAYRDGFSADQIIGRDVVGTQGETFGDVQSLILSPAGQIVRLVVEVGGFLDIGDKVIAVPWDQVELDTDGEAIRATDIDADNVEDFSLFGDREEIEPEERRFRADELMDDYVRTRDGRYVGLVSDLIFSREGELGGVVVTPDVRYPTASFLAFPFEGYGDGTGFQPAEDSYTVSAMDKEVAIYEPFRYREWRRSDELAL